ncbi:hypothetical protein EDD85DRAFT_785532 [Armillaria nabsnona]|nr:hypothetical protein EDD85DRAFT_785532 [Armillaria nabsnona]
MAPLAALIPTLQQGFSLTDIVLKRIEFNADIAAGLALIIPHFRMVHMEGCHYNAQEIGLLLQSASDLDGLHMGIGNICSFTSITPDDDEDEEISTVCLIPSAGSPIKSFSYHIESGFHFLLLSPAFTDAISPRMSTLHSIFIHCDYQAYDFMQGVVAASCDTLRDIDIVFNNWPGVENEELYTS